jgi:outer membrane protein insertion porin family
LIRAQSPAGSPPAYYQPPSGPPQYALPPMNPPMQFGGPPPQPGLGPSPGAGPVLNPGVVEQLAPPPASVQVFPEQDEWVNIVPTVEEARTGRLMFGVGVNSDAGVVGNAVLEEQNFDIMRWPSTWYEIVEGSAFRGAGQRFRLEAVPGTQVQRYMFNFTEPYLFDTPVSFGVSGFIYDRRFRDWTESRFGGQLSLGYQITPDLSFTSSVRAENVEVHSARTPTPQQVLDVLGDTDLYKARFALAHDTRDNVFLPTEGHLIEVAYEQAFGEFDYPRGTLDLRQFFLIRQRPDGSGRHVVGVGATLGVSGNDTPVMEHFFIGGTTTVRGFRFRGASPRELGTTVGGEFQFYGTVEYLAPITADDALRAVFFCDFGTVAPDIDSIEEDDFRVAPGFGLRITVPALGPAPIALDLAFPLAHADGDEIQNFSFRVGLFR